MIQNTVDINNTAPILFMKMVFSCWHLHIVVRVIAPDSVRCSGMVATEVVDRFNQTYVLVCAHSTKKNFYMTSSFLDLCWGVFAASMGTP